MSGLRFCSRFIMMRLLRRLLYFALTVLVLGVITVLLFAVLFDANRFKDKATQSFEKATGRTLAIHGDMHLHFLPLSLSFNEVEVGNPDHFSGDGPFAQVTLATADIALLPLLHREIRIKEVQLNGAQLHFLRLTDGRNNWDSWKKRQKESETANAKQAPMPVSEKNAFQVALESMVIKDAALVYRDLQKDRTIKFDLTEGHAEGIDNREKPFGIALKGLAYPPGLSEGAETKLSGKALIQGRHYELQDTQIDIALEKGLVLLSATLQLQYQEQALSYSLDPVRIACADLKAEGSGSGTEKLVSLDLNAAPFSPKECISLFTAKAQHLPEKASFSLHGQSDFKKVTLQVPAFQIDDSKGQAEANADLPKKEFSFHLLLDTFNLEPYTHPKETAAEEKKASATSESKTPKAQPVVGNKPGWGGHGKIEIHALRFKNLALNNVEIEPLYQQKKLDAPFSLGVANGRASGSFSAAMQETPSYAFTLDLKNVAIAPIVAVFDNHKILDGTLDGKLQVTAQGQESKALLSSNRGHVSFAVRDGTVYGFNLQAAIEKAKAKLTGDKNDHHDNGEKKTPFQRLEGNGSIVAASIDPGEFSLESELLDATGKGRVDFLARLLDYQVVAHPRGSLAKDLQNVAKELQGVAIPLRIYGNLDKPTVQVDIAALLAAQKKTAIERGLDKALEKAPKPVQDFLKQNMEKWF